MTWNRIQIHFFSSADPGSVSASKLNGSKALDLNIRNSNACLMFILGIFLNQEWLPNQIEIIETGLYFRFQINLKNSKKLNLKILSKSQIF